MTVYAYAANDMDTTNNRMSKTIFAYNPPGIAERLDRRFAVRDFFLGQNEPNPFHRSTAITYSLPEVSSVSLKVYDITGRLVETLVDQYQDPGMHQVLWEPKNESCGIYFCRLDAEGLGSTRKMILLR
jgi:hypothetical protein